MSDYSVVDYRAENEGYRCGYCHSSNTNVSHGMWAHQLAVGDYQDLIDRGWRRSGKYVYKPTMNRTCCPAYPIRCDVTEFKLTKSLKKVIKCVNNFLNYDSRPKAPSAAQCDDDRGQCQEMSSTGYKSAQARKVDLHTDADNQSSSDSKTTEKANSHSTELRHAEVKSQPKPGIGADPSKPSAKKAKLIRLEKKQAKAAREQETGNACSGPKKVSNEQKSKVTQAAKTLEDYLYNIIDKPAHRLEIKLVRPASNKRGNDSSASLGGSHAVFKKYQMSIHQEDESDCTFSQYKNFLVDTPLKQPSTLADRGNRLPDGFGSFHQLYLLDGKIIAVGVIDILPRCVSSVYLFYDPDYAFLSLGTYSALRELAFTRSLEQIDSAIRYYYLGFYIHSCPKMRYKAKYQPSYLCCPETYKWFPAEDCQPKLDVSKYCRFAEVGVVDDDRVEGDDDISQVCCLHQGTIMPYGVYRLKERNDANDEEVRQYAALVGRVCSQRLLLCR